MATSEKFNEFLDQIDDRSEYEDSSDDEDKNVNIFGQGLADKISRMPDLPPDSGEGNYTENLAVSKFQPSYLSSIQSIRTIGKEKLNKALQDRMNRLAIMDQNFKIVMNKRFLSLPRKTRESNNLQKTARNPENNKSFNIRKQSHRK